MMMSNGPVIGGFCLDCKNLNVIFSFIVTMYFRTRLQAACKDSRCFDSMKDEKSVGGFSCSSIGCFVSPKKAEWGNRGEGGRVGETVRLLYYNKAAKRGENMASKTFCSHADLELTDHRGHTAIMRAACEWAPTKQSCYYPPFQNVLACKAQISWDLNCFACLFVALCN